METSEGFFIYVRGVCNPVRMWLRRVSKGERDLVARAVVQITKKATYMSVQDKYGAILATARWEGRLTFREATDLLRAENLYLAGEWRNPRTGVYVVYVNDVQT